MALDINNPLDPNSEDAQRLLADLQGNILKGHGREHSVLLFLKMRDDANLLSVAEQIRNFADSRITSAQKQLVEAEDFRRSGGLGNLFANFFLSQKGYERLFLEVAPTQPPDIRFSYGMRESGPDLGDPSSTQWEASYQGEIHAAILLAHDSETILNREAHHISTAISEVADIVASERGTTLRNLSHEPIEPFGYVDGRSQPLFLTNDIAREQQREDIRKENEWRFDPSAPLRLVLRRDEYGEGEYSYGSYFVFRKLAQNVRGFREAVRKLAVHLGINEQLAAALVVGRFVDGTPVALRDGAGLSNPVPNNFNYENDPHGLRCPFHAHIRKTNPRNRIGESLVIERDRRIARRGIPYGNFTYPLGYDAALSELPTEGVGLLFMCFQGDIGEQFESIQRIWANESNHPVGGTGVDPLIGKSQGCLQPQRWPAGWGVDYKRPFSFQDFVTLKGGEYFFAPSISALKNLHAHMPQPQTLGE